MNSAESRGAEEFRVTLQKTQSMRLFRGLYNEETKTKSYYNNRKACRELRESFEVQKQ